MGREWPVTSVGARSRLHVVRRVVESRLEEVVLPVLPRRHAQVVEDREKAVPEAVEARVKQFSQLIKKDFVCSPSTLFCPPACSQPPVRLL